MQLLATSIWIGTRTYYAIQLYQKGTGYLKEEFQEVSPSYSYKLIFANPTYTIAPHLTLLSRILRDCQNTLHPLHSVLHCPYFGGDEEREYRHYSHIGSIEARLEMSPSTDAG